MLMADKIYVILKTSIGNKSLQDFKLRNLHYPEYKHAKIEIITKKMLLIIQKIETQISVNFHIAKKKQNLIEFTPDIKLNRALISMTKTNVCLEINVNIRMTEQYLTPIFWFTRISYN